MTDRTIYVICPDEEGPSGGHKSCTGTSTCSTGAAARRSRCMANPAFGTPGRIFLSLSSAEGFGLPPAEAMACGCVTIGYHGRCGLEFFRPEFSYPIELGDIKKDYARTVERVIREIDGGAAPFERMTHAAAAYVARHYSVSTETETILRCWDAITRS